MAQTRHFKRAANGFTLIEVLVVMGLIAVVVALTTVNLGRPQTAASMSSIVDTLRADLRNQQLRAMSGDTGGTNTAQTYGVYIQANQYTLFSGSTYSTEGSDNFSVPADTGISLSTTLPANQAVFTKGTGGIEGITTGSNSITISDTRSGDSVIITLNRYGTVTIQ